MAIRFIVSSSGPYRNADCAWFYRETCMFVIAIAQIKGGVGKTTLAINLAGELASRSYSTLLLDMDPQKSASQWAAPQQLEFRVRESLPNPRGLFLWVRDTLKE